MNANFATVGYLIAGVCFILALRGLSHPTTSRAGNRYGMAGMALAVAVTLLSAERLTPLGLVLVLAGLAGGGAVGFIVAKRIEMTAMPQLVAAFHSLVGLAAVLVAGAALLDPAAFHLLGADGTIRLMSRAEMGLGAVIGAVTFTGSLIAFGKLQAKLPANIEQAIPAPLRPALARVMSSQPLMLPGRHLINIALGVALLALLVLFVAHAGGGAFVLMILLALALGLLLIMPIGGADMPVVVSMLNSYSGWAAAGIGFTLHNPMLIITGALVGSSGAILSYIMCKAMNRSFVSVILGGFGETGAAGPAGAATGNVKTGSAEDAAFIMSNAQKVIIVPGYGMAVAQAQHSVRELYDMLVKAGIDVKFAIHPVAGRMPGHMNVLLAEANIPYDVVHEMDEINGEFSQADVAYVIGANDITNPAAKTDKASPIYGMPVLDVDRAKAVFFVKRSMASGYAGIDNALFTRDNTIMLLADAKKMTESIVKSLAA